MKQPLYRITSVVRAKPAQALLFSIFISACSLFGVSNRETAETSDRFQSLLIAGAYTGLLPCADCSGIRYTLNLRSGFIYFLRVTYLPDENGEGRGFDDLGVWSVSTDRQTLLLRGSREEPLLFAIKSFNTLRKLDRDGGEIRTLLNYDLTRDETGARLEPHLQLKGRLAQSGTGSVLNECLTGIQLPIAHGGDSAKLEANYEKTREQAERNLFVKIEGQIVRTPNDGTMKEQEKLVVQRLVELSTEERCAGPPRSAKLEDTDWKLIYTINGRFDSDGIYLRLRSRGTGMRLFDGCNVIYGGYAVREQKLRFFIDGITRWNCTNAAYEQRRWLETLQASSNYNIVDQRLELYDSRSRLLAGFEAKAKQ